MLALLIAAALAAPTPAPSLPQLKIATLQLEAAGVPEGMAASATVLVPTEVRLARPDAQLISSEDVRSLLSHQKNRLVLGCGADAACLADLGGALGVDEIVAGRLGRLGETWVLELRRLDVKQARNLASATRAVTSADALVGAVRSAAWELYAGPGVGRRPSGPPVVLAAPAAWSLAAAWPQALEVAVGVVRGVPRPTRSWPGSASPTTPRFPARAWSRATWTSCRSTTRGRATGPSTSW